MKFNYPRSLSLHPDYQVGCAGTEVPLGKDSKTYFMFTTSKIGLMLTTVLKATYLYQKKNGKVNNNEYIYHRPNRN